MYLIDLLKYSVVKSEEEIDLEQDIIIIPAYTRSDLSYALVISKPDFENLLINYRAVEPSSEVVLMSIGNKSKEDSEKLAELLLQNEAISGHYLKLCAEKEAKKLEEFSLKENEENMVHIPEEVVKEDGEIFKTAIKGPVSNGQEPEPKTVDEDVKNVIDEAFSEEDKGEGVETKDVDSVFEEVPIDPDEEENQEGLAAEYLSVLQDLELTCKECSVLDICGEVGITFDDFISNLTGDLMSIESMSVSESNTPDEVLWVLCDAMEQVADSNTWDRDETTISYMKNVISYLSDILYEGE